MSESNSGSESSYSNTSSYSHKSPRSSESSSSGESSNNNRYQSPSETTTTVDSTVNFTQIKQKLKLIEIAVTKEFNNEEKSAFIQLFRKVIVDNEQEVIAFPTATFFIAKFEDLNSPLLTEHFKTKILNSLHMKQYEEKQSNSKLKYW